MAVYYFRNKDTQAKNYIRRCIVDAFKSEGMSPRDQNFRVFNKHDHTYTDLEFTKVKICMPTKRINTKINFRLHRNGRKYNIFKEDENKRGLYLIKDVRGIVGQKIDELFCSSPDHRWTQIKPEQVKSAITGEYPTENWFLNEDHTLLINTPINFDKPSVVYKNVCNSKKIKTT